MIGRPKGIPCKKETKEKISKAIKQIWDKQKKRRKKRRKNNE
jgi:hypothetical protein